MKKCSKCGCKKGHKMSCPTQKITIIMDITKCVGTDCPKKESCKRYTAPVSDFNQSWFCECPLKDGKCDMYWGKNAESIFNQLKEIVNGKGEDCI